MRAPAVVSFLVLAAVPAEPATLRGLVRTSDGRPVPNVAVVLQGGPSERSLLTGPGGRFVAESLPPGTYTVVVEAPGLAAASPLRAEVGSSDLAVEVTLAVAPVREQIVVAATRGEAASTSVGVPVATLDAERLAAARPATVLDALQDLPSVAVARTGGVGLQASLFVRGGGSNATRILVDGVPANEPGGFLDLGAELPLELERVELVRGAASAVYGTDALAGVLALYTARASDGLGGRAEAEGGSFAWRKAAAQGSGRHGRGDWNAGLLRLETDNEQPNSRFEATGGALAAGWQLSPFTGLRGTLRGSASTVGTPGPLAFGRPDLDASFERSSSVGSLRLVHDRGRARHELRLSHARIDQLSLNPEDSGPYVPSFAGRRAPFAFFDFTDALGYQNETRRTSLGWQVDVAAGARHLLTAGAEVERESGSIGSRSDQTAFVAPRRDNAGLYVQDRVLLGDRVFAVLGARVERNDSFGWAAVPRAAVAWQVRRGAEGTVVRASAGLGIKEPTFLESFGVSFFAEGNPDLEAEKSRTADLGVEQWLAGGRVRLEAVAFHHRYRDQVAYRLLDPATFRGSYVNLGQTRARGLELALHAAPTGALRLDAQYTLTAGEVVVSTGDFDEVYAAGRSLLRRPRHQGSLSATWRAARAELTGRLLAVGRRADSDFAGLGLLENDGHARVDVRARVDASRRLQVLLAADNVLDRAYHDVLGYPAPGRSLRAGLAVRVGRLP